ncbi:hypothetical protein GF327_06865 [Candidatus Woesearchaeota archaeon]|nr:hypothetical protein [Candidatus Woesearchaeota archaeon]
MNDKKSQTYTALNWVFIRIPLVIIVLIFYLMILNMHNSTELSGHNIENIILIKRLLYSPGLLAYQDTQTGRVYPGIIDIEKFDTKIIESVLLNKNNRIAANLELKNIKTGEIKRIYINEERASAWDDYITFDEFDSSFQKRHVRISQNNQFYPGTLKIKVYVRNG